MEQPSASEDRTFAPIDPGVDIGHVHLKVADIDRALAFYRDVLGFELQQRFGTEAAFVSAGGYHHHIGLNTWAGVGAPPPPPGAIGLRHFVVKMPSAPALAATSERLRAAAIPTESVGEGLLVHDPADNAILLSIA